MKILIIGAGSIGQRHLRNLMYLGIKDIAVLDINEKKLREVEKKYKIKTYKNLKTSLREKWNAVFICTFSSSHIKIALEVAEKRSPIFIEKPLSNNLKDVSVLLKKVKKSNIPVMIGYNLMFHPQIEDIRKILKDKKLGKIWGVRAEFGRYLPGWHSREDYRKGYSAQRKLGGGVVLDCIHEIDYLYHLFGKVKKIFALTEKISNLEINTEDYAEMIFWFKNSLIGEIHMDYLQRIPSRNLKIIGERGTLIWDLMSAELKYFLVKDKKWFFKKINNFDYNQTYIKEIKYFLDCLKNNKRPQSGIDRGYETLKIALAVKKSAKLEKIINL